jgi:hypothetical protein
MVLYLREQGAHLTPCMYVGSRVNVCSLLESFSSLHQAPKNMQTLCRHLAALLDMQPLRCHWPRQTGPEHRRPPKRRMGNDGETTSNERSQSKGREHLRSAPTTA